MRLYTVFNLEQTDLAGDDRWSSDEPREAVEPIQAVQDLYEGYADAPELLYRPQDRAYYEPLRDRIVLPEADQFNGAEQWAATLCHELTHSTGHSSRLDRFGRNGEPQHFGSERYAKEELVAELGASMLLGIAGVDWESEQSAAYVASWLKALKGDRSLLVGAAQQAQKAVDRIIGAEAGASVAGKEDATAAA
jgi:antirestriction protein ArdC